jgi:hypothetical protein
MGLDLPERQRWAERAMPVTVRSPNVASSKSTKCFPGPDLGRKGE